jgi:hypothetical protein
VNSYNVKASRMVSGHVFFVSAELNSDETAREKGICIVYGKRAAGSIGSVMGMCCISDYSNSVLKDPCLE